MRITIRIKGREGGIVIEEEINIYDDIILYVLSNTIQNHFTFIDTVIVESDKSLSICGDDLSKSDLKIYLSISGIIV